MSQGRPKIEVRSQTGVSAEDLARRLGDRFEVVAEARSTGAALVLASAMHVASGETATALLEAIGQGAVHVGPGGEVLWANRVFRAYDEGTRQQIARRCVEAARRLADGKGGDLQRAELALPDSRSAFELVVWPAGQRGVVALVQDVTAEREIRRKIDAIDQAGGELMSLSAESVRKLNSLERLAMLERKVIAWCHDLMNFDHFCIRLIDEQSRRMEPVMSSGAGTESTELELYARPEGNGINGYVAATGRSYICYDTERDVRFVQGSAGTRSSLTVPLKLGDKTVGVFDIESERVGAFTETDRQFAEIFGRYVAMALHMLDLLVVERSSTNQTLTGRVEGELDGPLADIMSETDWLRSAAARDPEVAQHVDRIRADVEAIRSRVRDVAQGPQTLIGLERELHERQREPAFEGRRVLVADDHPNIRRIVRDVLHNRGCEVVTAESGLRAIELIDEAVAAGGFADGRAFDLIISDIKMPDRNGYEVFAAARRAFPGIRVILMTGFGYDPHHSIVRASQEGLQSVLFKPFAVERLVDEARKAITRAPR